MIFKGPVNVIKLFRVSCAHTARFVEAHNCRAYQDDQIPDKAQTETEHRYAPVFMNFQGLVYQSPGAKAQVELKIKVNHVGMIPKCVGSLTIVARFYSGALSVNIDVWVINCCNKVSRLGPQGGIVTS